MITVLYFARLREQLGLSRETVNAVEGETVQQLVSRLVAGKGSCAEVLFAEDTQTAVNQEIAEPGTLLNDGDEVAFFPPVTGG